MGFITTIDNYTGREVYACEVQAEGCDRTGCRAHYCPFGWCQRYYICRSCWSKPETRKMFSKAGHEARGCKEESENFARKQAEAEELKAAGKFLRVAALNVDELGVQVLFTSGTGETIGRYMPVEVYQAIGYGVNAVLEDYQVKAAGLGFPTEFKEAPAVFGNTGQATKQII